MRSVGAGRFQGAPRGRRARRPGPPSFARVTSGYASPRSISPGGPRIARICSPGVRPYAVDQAGSHLPSASGKFTGRVRAPLIAVLVAATTGLVCETGFNIARDSAPTLAYLGLCAALTLTTALVVAGLGGFFQRGAVISLALWAGLHGLLFFGPVPAVGFALATAAILWPGHDGREDASWCGVAVALALCVAVIAWPRAMQGRDSWLWPHTPLYRDLSMIGVVAATLLALVSYRQLRRFVPWAPPATPLALAVLVLTFIVVPAYTWPGQSTALPHYDATAATPTLPNIVLLVLDTVRADHLSLYGYERDTTPSLERFVTEAGRAVVYPMAFSESSWTVPSHASLFTGLIPSEHGAHRGNQGDSFSFAAMKDVTTLAELLKRRGYRTAAIFANPTPFRVKGLMRGFDVAFRPSSPRPLLLIGEALRGELLSFLLAGAVRPYADARAVNAEVLRFLDACAPGPCFVVANYMEAHVPYVPEPPHADRFSGGTRLKPPLTAEKGASLESLRYAEARYDEEIRSLDAQLSSLLSELERRGVLQDSWLVITADHGEAFGEHGGFEHGNGVHNDEVRIPLIIQPPRGVTLPGRRDAVSLVDVTATLAAIANAPKLGSGRDLRASDAGVRPVQIELFALPGAENGAKRTQQSGRAVVLDTLKLLERGGHYELYRLEADPFEQHDLANEEKASVDKLAHLLPPLRHGKKKGRSTRLDFEEEQRLRALGYIE